VTARLDGRFSNNGGAARNAGLIEVIGDLLAGLLLEGAQAEDGFDDGGFTERKTGDGLPAEDEPSRIAIALLAIVIGQPRRPATCRSRPSEDATQTQEAGFLITYR